MNQLKNKLYYFLLNQGIEPEYDVFDYGYKIFTKYLTFLIIIIPLSLLFNIFIETIVFLAVFISLRQYLGGIHIDNSFLCMFFSIIISLLIPIIARLLKNINLPSFIIVFIISEISILILGPIDHKNKRLSSIEKKYFKRKSFLIILLYFFICCFLYFFKQKIYINIILLTIILNIFNLIVASMNEHYH